eukprot:7132424-Alexandrium_andersonii.AAC.1
MSVPPASPCSPSWRWAAAEPSASRRRQRRSGPSSAWRTCCAGSRPARGGRTGVRQRGRRLAMSSWR